MKNKKLLLLKTILIVLILSTFSSCSPRISSQLFYDYKKSDDGFYEFNGRWYSVLIRQEELDRLPNPVKRYLEKSDLVGKERCAELFYQYGGNVKLKGYTLINLTKHYRIAEHTSTLEPRFSAKGKSFPIVADFDLNEKGTINASMTGFSLPDLKNRTGEEVDDFFTLKYLTLMVWYPTAFLNNNIHWGPVFDNGVLNPYQIKLSLQEGNLTASGKLIFDSTTTMPLSFQGMVTNEINNYYEIDKFDITYSKYKKIDNLYLPEKCMATIENNIEQKITVIMELDKLEKPDFEDYFRNNKELPTEEKMKTYFTQI